MMEGSRQKQRRPFSDTYNEMENTIWNIDLLDYAGRNVDIFHWNDFSKLLQTTHIFDLTAELGAVEKR